MLKKSMDILDVYAISRIYPKLLLDGIIDNVYFADFYWLIKINTKSGPRLLKVEPGVRLHLSRIEPERERLDRFTQFLRKRIRGLKISNVEQLGWERIVLINLSGPEAYRLVVEVIPRGFAILLDENNVILYASRFEELRDRVVKPKAPYKPPPGNYDREFYFQKLRESIYVGKDTIRGLTKGWGLPGYLAEEIIYRAGLYESKLNPPDSLSKTDVENMVQQYLVLIKECETGSSYIVYGDGEPELYVCYEPKLFREVKGLRVIFVADMNEAIDSYFAFYEKKVLENKILSSRKVEIDKIVKAIAELEGMKEEFKAKYDENMRIYNLLIANFVKVEDLLNCVNRVREEYGWDKVVDLCKGVINVDKHSGTFYVNLDNTLVKLDVRLNTWGNINAYSAKAGEFLNSIRRIDEKIEEFKRRHNELLNEIRVEEARTSSLLKPKFWFMRFHWLITRSGFIAVGGRNADQNESLVKKVLKPNDIFIHADIHGAPAVVLITEGKTPLEKDINDAAVITACYSKAWRVGFGYVDYYWVKGSQVSKKAPSGEYLAKGSFMVYGERNYGRVELKLSIGLEEVHDEIYGEYRRIIIGPQDLVEGRSLVYVTIAPGSEDPDKLSKRIYRVFQKKTGSEALGITLDEIRRVVPGPSRLINLESI